MDSLAARFAFLIEASRLALAQRSPLPIALHFQ
jgi:hypothetical protein